MRGLDPGIHVFSFCNKFVDGRVKTGHDAVKSHYTLVISNFGFWPLP
jgi:hypothetical protein